MKERKAKQSYDVKLAFEHIRSPTGPDANLGLYGEASTTSSKFGLWTPMGKWKNMTEETYP